MFLQTKIIVISIFLSLSSLAVAGEHCYDENTEVEVLGLNASHNEFLVSEYCFQKGGQASSTDNENDNWYNKDWCRADLYTAPVGSENAMANFKNRKLFHAPDPTVGAECATLKTKLAAAVNKALKDFLPLGQTVRVDSSDKKHAYEIATMKYPDPINNDGSFLVEKKKIKGRTYMALLYAKSAAEPTLLKGKLAADVDGAVLPYYLLFWQDYVTGVTPGLIWSFKLENSRITKRK